MKNIVLITFLFLAACNSAKEDNPKFQNTAQSQYEKFTFNFPHVDFEYHDRVLPYNGGFICFLNNQKIIAFDSSYNRVPKLERELKNFKADYIFNLSDTTWLLKKKLLFYLTNDKKIKKANSFPIADTLLFQHMATMGLYQDEHYFVYGCSFGEFGGNVFFHDKKSGKEYTYDVSAPVEVLHSKYGYEIFSVLLHLGRSEHQVIINDPQKIFTAKLQEEYKSKESFCCNCYVSNEVRYKFYGKSYDSVKKSIGVIDTDLIFRDYLLPTFILAFNHKNETYTLRQGSAYYFLNIRNGLNEKTIDSFKSPIFMRPGEWDEVQSFPGGYLVRCKDGRIVKVLGTKIDILQYVFREK